MCIGGKRNLIHRQKRPITLAYKQNRPTIPGIRERINKRRRTTLQNRPTIPGIRERINKGRRTTIPGIPVPSTHRFHHRSVL